MIASRDDLERRILILAPTGKDGELTQSLLSRAGIDALCCSDFQRLVEELDAGAAGVLVAEEGVLSGGTASFAAWLARQPPWSDLPVLLLARPGADSETVTHVMEILGNVTVLERPARITAMVSAVRSALRARQRQYQIRDYLADRDRAEQSLRDADRRKDEFLAVLAHELRNPLAPIRNSLHILRLTNQGNPAAERVAEMMERQVGNMVRLVDDLLEVSRITRGKIELRKEAVEVAAVVRNAVETSRPLIEAAGHEFALAIPPDTLTIEGDPVRLTQVIANLLNNAAKYTNPGGHVSLTVRHDDESVLVIVKDSGIGIPPEMLLRVFEPFTQINQESLPARGGLGIGLTLVKRLVEMHAGTVEARSAGAGRGSEFVLRFPLIAAQRASGLSAKEVRAPGALAAQRVLVVDDNRDAAESLGMLLKLLGAQVHVVHSGTEALEAIASYHPAVVLLDIGMPEMDGYEVARRIRDQAEFEGVLLIALTGWGQDADRDRSKHAGFDYHLIKPADLAALESLLLRLPERPSSRS